MKRTQEEKRFEQHVKNLKRISLKTRNGIKVEDSSVYERKKALMVYAKESIQSLKTCLGDEDFDKVLLHFVDISEINSEQSMTAPQKMQVQVNSKRKAKGSTKVAKGVTADQYDAMAQLVLEPVCIT